MLIFIKQLTLSICSIITYKKILNLKLQKYGYIYVVFYSLIATTLATITEIYIPYLLIPILIIPFALFFSYIFNLSVDFSTTLSIIAYSISYITFILSTIISATIVIAIIPQDNYTSMRIISHLITMLIHICIVFLLFLPKRMRRGMPFIINRLNSTPLTFISSTTLILIMIMTINLGYNPIFISTCFVSFLFALFIYIYWRNNLTRTYIEKLRERDIRDLNTQLDTTENILNEIKADKGRLSAIVHTDNKLVPAMIQAVESFLTDFPNATPEMVARGEEILHTLDGYMESRKDDLAEQDKKCFIKMTSTGIPAVNLTLEHMYAKAQANDTALAVNVEADVDFLSKTTVSEDELNTMISDLLEKAVIATSYTDNKRILFTIGMLDNALSISVFDSGIPFTKEVLVDFGREKHTTHGDTGGSGIGLMTIYEIAHKHRATIAIEENDTEQSHYTKRIAITFNKRGNYILNTLRDKEEIAYLRQRTDLIINLKSSKM